MKILETEENMILIFVIVMLKIYHHKQNISP